jgi:cytochrome b6-f complex iron-sulfur subunit
MSAEDPTKKDPSGPAAEPATTTAPRRPAPNEPNIPAWASGSHPDLLKSEGVPPAPAAKAAEVKPVPPATAAPKPAAAKTAPELERREFLNWLALGWIAFSAASAAGLTALGRFFFPNVLFEPPSVFKVGYPEDFADGVVDERFKEKFRIWVVREGNQIYALFAQCTHLGCTPNWLAPENKFKCPCHGSGFYRSGINFEGPAPRPLERVKIQRADDGQILIDKSVVYAQEKGQWSDPSSFLVV